MEAVENEISQSDDDFTENKMELYVEQMNTFRDSIYADANDSIKKSQQKQKKDYDNKRRKMKVSVHKYDK